MILEALRHKRHELEAEPGLTLAQSLSSAWKYNPKPPHRPLRSEDRVLRRNGKHESSRAFPHKEQVFETQQRTALVLSRQPSPLRDAGSESCQQRTDYSAEGEAYR